jgi:7-keto-8-aminopelargonate synthetase-like enzyme
LVSHGLYLPQELGELKARVGGGFVSGMSTSTLARPVMEPAPPRLPSLSTPAAASAAPDAAFARLTALEAEVSSLREEVRSLRAMIEMLGSG